MFAGTRTPCQWIVVGEDMAFFKCTITRSPTLARMTGPGHEPLYVRTSVFTPGQISTGAMRASRSISTTFGSGFLSTASTSEMPSLKPGGCVGAPPASGSGSAPPASGAPAGDVAELGEHAAKTHAAKSETTFQDMRAKASHDAAFRYVAQTDGRRKQCPAQDLRQGVRGCAGATGSSSRIAWRTRWRTE